VPLGDLSRRLHAAGVYHNDLKDVNVLVRDAAEGPDFVLLDLERVHVGAAGRRRRIKNLVQLERTLGREASGTMRQRFLRAYLGRGASRAERRTWAAAVVAAAARKERDAGHTPAAGAPGPRACAAGWQGGGAHIAARLGGAAGAGERG